MTGLMTHPLNNQTCCQLWEDNKDNWLKHLEPCPATRRVMRAAADWQLEQVMRWLEENLSNYADDGYFKPFYESIPDFKEAMRPQEINN